MATSLEEFMKQVKPEMLNSKGQFLGPGAGVNYNFEGMTPQEVYSSRNDPVAMGRPGESNLTKANPLANDPINLGWIPGPDNGGGAWGAIQKNPAAMAALIAITGGAAGAFTGGAAMGTGSGMTAATTGVGGAAGAGAAGAGLGAASAGGLAAGEGLTAATAAPVTGGWGSVAGTALPELGAAVPATAPVGGGFMGSLTMPELAGSIPAGVEGFSSMIPAAGEAVGSGLIPAGTGTLGGATTAGGAMIGAGTAAEGAAAGAGAGSGGFMDTVSSIAKTPGVSSLVGGALKGLIGGVVNNALSPPTSGPNSAINAADPFHDQRAQYQPQLQEMIQGKFDPTDPSYKFRFEQGQQATERAAAAAGMGVSGNALTALTQYGQGMASTEYQNQFNRLSQLSGANFGTGGAGNIAQQNANAQQGSANAVTNGIVNFGQGLYDTWNKSVTGDKTSLPSIGNLSSDNYTAPSLWDESVGYA